MLKTVLLLIVSIFGLALALPAKERSKLPRLDGRIVGGENASIEDYPYQVSLFHNGNHICGGSIISTRYVVTAAHCTDGSSASELSVRVGSSELNSGGFVVNVSSIAQNSKFTKATFDYDVSVLKLASSLSLSSSVLPIALQTSTEQLADSDDAVVTGWGVLEEDGSSPKQLQTVTVKIVNRAICTSAYGESEITNNMMCAGVTNGGKDACQGDSGGPLVVKGRLAGIVSWGYGCARPNFPGVYSNVATLSDYIIDNSDLK